MDLKKAYGVDKDAAENGKWFITASGMEVKVAKIGNPAFVAEITRLQKRDLALLRTNSEASVKQNNKNTIEAIAKTVLIDWKAESDGEPVPYTWELGAQAMTDFSDFHEDVSALSLSRENFKPEEVAEK